MLYPPARFIPSTQRLNASAHSFVCCGSIILLIRFVCVFSLSLFPPQVYSHKRYCPCEHGETVNVVTPLYPNPWRKKAWGAFTAFRVGWGTSLFRSSPQWRSVVTSGDYAHFDEWWGTFHYSRGWETMGDVLTRLAEVEGGGAHLC